MRTFVGTAVTAFAAVVLAAGPARAADDDKASKTISAGKVARDAKDFYGKHVTVQAEVEDVLGTDMFTLDEDSILAGPDVLVLVPGGLTTALVHDQKVTVQGEVRRYVEADLDRDFDFFDEGRLVNVKTKVDWDTRPVIVAHSIRTGAGAEVMREGHAVMAKAEHMKAGHKEAPMVRRTSVATTSAGRMEAISAGKLAKDYKDFLGRSVTVRAEVEDVLGANMFTLDEDAILAGPDVLVLVPGGLTAALTHDQVVTVTGDVRTYVEADLDRDFDFFENGKLVEVKEKVDWETRPVIVARSIRTASGTELIGESR